MTTSVCIDTLSMLKFEYCNPNFICLAHKTVCDSAAYLCHISKHNTISSQLTYRQLVEYPTTATIIGQNSTIEVYITLKISYTFGGNLLIFLKNPWKFFRFRGNLVFKLFARVNCPSSRMIPGTAQSLG